MGLFVTSASESGQRSEVDRTWWISLAVLCAILGALLGISFKAQHQIRQYNLPSANYEGLAEQYKILKSSAEDRNKRIASLQHQVGQLERAVPSNNSRLAVMSQDLQHSNFLAGLTDVGGPGILVTLNDSKKRALNAPVVVQDLGIIHDTDINGVVNELKAAGAEAISINKERIVSLTAARCAGPTVFVNNIPQTPPYVIRAIGDGPTLETALKLPGGVFDLLSQYDATMINIETSDKLMIPAYTGPTQPRYAKPLLTPISSGGG
jgi:uncharacterized protein YlxW (UPF0749 family)